MSLPHPPPRKRGPDGSGPFLGATRIPPLAAGTGPLRVMAAALVLTAALVGCADGQSADGPTTTAVSMVESDELSPWFGGRRVVEGGCRQFPAVATIAEPAALTLDTARWDEAVVMRVDAVESCRAGDGVADEVLRVTVLRHVAGREDRGVGVRRLAQLAPGWLGDSWPERELVAGDEVIALIGPPDPAMTGQDPLPFVGLVFDVAHGRATPRYGWFTKLRGGFNESAGPFEFTVSAVELEAALQAAGHGR